MPSAWSDNKQGAVQPLSMKHKEHLMAQSYPRDLLPVLIEKFSLLFLYPGGYVSVYTYVCAYMWLYIDIYVCTYCSEQIIYFYIHKEAADTPLDRCTIGAQLLNNCTVSDKQ